MSLFDFLTSLVPSSNSPSSVSALRRTRRRRLSTQIARAAREGFERLESRSLMAADLIVSPLGDDLHGLGTIDAPFATIRRALDAASPGDTISLRNGVYQGGLNIDIDNLAIRSYPGEWGVIEAPVDDPQFGSVVRYLNDVEGGRLENVEIVGGYWYGVKLEDWWDNPGPDAVRRGASQITIVGCKIHDTGWDAVKIVPGADDITIENNEIFNPGRRLRASADGIDNNNGDRMIARNNYLHDIPGVGILTTGGTHDSLIEGNLIVDVAGAGITVGFYSELEWMDQDSNPELYTSFHTIARNNIVVNAGQAGVGVYASYKPVVEHNTLINSADDAQAPIQLGGVDIWVSNTLPDQHVASVDPVIRNNLISLDEANLTRLFDARFQSYVGTLTVDGNLYHAPSVLGARFVDRNATGEGTPEMFWSQWVATGRDAHGILQNPQLDAHYHLTATSPARDAAIPSGAPTHDFDGQSRTDGMPDIGADEFVVGASRLVPPPAFGAPSLEFTARAAHASEGETVEVTVRRNGFAGDQLTVDYRTLAGSATEHIDYLPIAGTLTFAPGETEKRLLVPFITDGTVEGNEHLLLALSNPTTQGTLPVRVGWQGSMSLTIDDAQAAQPVHYRTLWVSNVGSDVTGDGSQEHPWKSLQFAADNVGPGDYVIVEPGNYWGFQITTDGKEDAPITFHARPGVLIDEPNPENRLDGINLEGADHVVIEGFEVRDMPRTGIRSVLNTGAVIRDNVVDHNGYWGILTGWSDNLLVENNVASRSVREHGIYISNSSDDGVVRNNLVWGNHDSGIQFNADGYLEGDGVHSRNLIEGNVIFDNGRGGGAAINLDGFQDGVVRNNLLYDNHSTGIVLYVGFAAQGSKNNQVVNNTVVQADDARWAVLIENDSTGNSLRNNIFLNANPARGSISIDDGSLAEFDSDYNVFVDRFIGGGWQMMDFESWQAATGQDAHSLLASADQLFIDAGAFDFRLSDASPAVDAGDAAAAPPFDLYQRLRPAGDGVDIGAWESGDFAPLVAFAAPDFVTYEESGMALVTLVRSGDLSQPLAIAYELTDGAITDGTATADVDFEARGGSVSFRAGESTKTIQIVVHDDATIEPLETFTIRLADPPSEFSLGAQATATVHIVSDDQWSPGKFQFQTKYMAVSEAEGVATVTVMRTDGANGPAAVNYSTSLFTPPPAVNYVRRHTWNPQPTDDDEPATAGVDFEMVAGTLEFGDGETTKSFTIPLLGDRWFERDEALRVTLSEPTQGATLGKVAEAFVSIVNDDEKQPGAFQFLTPTVTMFEGQAYGALVVERVGGDNVAASVRLYVSGGNGDGSSAAAWQPGDFGSLPEQLDFAPGESSKTLLVPLVEDSQVEVDEFFQVQLYAATNDAAIGDASRATVRIRDNDSSIEFAQAGVFSASEGAAEMTVTVVRKGSTLGEASVDYSMYDETAVDGVDYVRQAGTVTFADGQSTKTIVIPVVNDLIVEPNETFGLTLRNFTGAAAGVYQWGRATIVNDDAAAQPGVIELSSASYSAAENGGGLLVTVVRTGGSDGTVTASYSTADGAAGYGWSKTAWAGGDFGSANGTLVFVPGETVKTFSVPLLNDSNVEQDEVFTVKLTGVGGGATLGATKQAVATILEDDSTVYFRAPNGASSFTVKENGGAAEVVVVRQGGTAGAASVTVKTVDWWSARPGSDFTPMTTVVQFAAGESTKTVLIPIVNDGQVESAESFGVSMSNAVGAAQGSWTWSVNIQDDDNVPQPGQFQFQYSAFSSQENWGYAVIYVTRTGGSSGAASVDFTATGVTATAGVDFQPVSGTLSFADGETTKTFQVPLLDDALAELDEDLFLSLANPTGGATLGSIDAALLTLISDE